MEKITPQTPEQQNNENENLPEELGRVAGKRIEVDYVDGDSQPEPPLEVMASPSQPELPIGDVASPHNTGEFVLGDFGRPETGAGAPKELHEEGADGDPLTSSKERDLTSPYLGHGDF